MIVDGRPFKDESRPLRWGRRGVLNCFQSLLVSMSLAFNRFSCPCLWLSIASRVRVFSWSCVGVDEGGLGPRQSGETPPTVDARTREAIQVPTGVSRQITRPAEPPASHANFRMIDTPSAAGKSCLIMRHEPPASAAGKSCLIMRPFVATPVCGDAGWLACCAVCGDAGWRVGDTESRMACWRWRVGDTGNAPEDGRSVLISPATVNARKL